MGAQQNKQGQANCWERQPWLCEKKLPTLIFAGISSGEILRDIDFKNSRLRCFIYSRNKQNRKTSNPAPHFMCFDLQKGKVELLPPICRVAHQHTTLHQDHSLHPSHIVRLSQAQVVKELGGAHVFQDAGWARVFHSRWDIICIHPWQI